jgi:hypothetical protein
MVGISRWRFGSDDGVAVMVGASRRMRQYGTSQYCSHNMVQYCNIVPYGNIAILYGTHLLSLLILTILSACGGFLSSRKSVAPAERYNLFFKTPPSDPPKNATAAQPLSACTLINLVSVFFTHRNITFCLPPFVIIFTFMLPALQQCRAFIIAYI